MTSVFAVPVMNKLKEYFPVQIRWTTAGDQADAEIWRQVNNGPLTQGAVVGSERKVRTKMVLDKRNYYAVRAYDSAGNASEFLVSRSYKPRVIDDKDPKVKYAQGLETLPNRRGPTTAHCPRARVAAGPSGCAFKGSAVSLAVFRTANSGKVRIYIDGKPKMKLNLRSNKVQAKRVVLELRVQGPGQAPHRDRATVGRAKGLVFLDGFVVLG